MKLKKKKKQFSGYDIIVCYTDDISDVALCIKLTLPHDLLLYCVIEFYTSESLSHISRANTHSVRVTGSALIRTDLKATVQSHIRNTGL